MSSSSMDVEGVVENRGGDTHNTKTSATTLISDKTPFRGIGSYSDDNPTSLRSVPDDSPKINHVQVTPQANWDDDCFDRTTGWDGLHVRPLGFDEGEEPTHSTVLWVESKLARKAGAQVSPQPLCQVSESEELREESPSRDTSTEPRYTSESASTSVSGSISASPPPGRKRPSNVPRRPSSPTHGRLLPVYSPPSTIPALSLTSSSVTQKRSRGRMVPTVGISPKDLEGEEEGEGESVGRKLRKTSRRGEPLPTGRSHVCLVEGCGKCFRRREHLKRHTTSLHTEQRSFVCPFPGCGKSFSRSDNMMQHGAVHKKQ